MQKALIPCALLLVPTPVWACGNAMLDASPSKWTTAAPFVLVGFLLLAIFGAYYIFNTKTDVPQETP